MQHNRPTAAIIYALLLFAPIYWLATAAFKTNGEIMSGFTFVPTAPSLTNLTTILTDPDWYWGYLNAMIYVGINVVLSTLVAIPAAYAFSRFDFAGKRALFFGFLMFRMMAPAILLVPFVQMFSDLGLLDTHLAVALAHCFFNVPLAIWILEGFISSVPRQIDESAAIDGYAPLGFFRKILLPQIAPGIAVTAFFCFMFSWVEHLMANGLTQIDAKPISGIMTRAGGVLSADIAMLAAASLVGLIPGVILLFFMRNHLARGFSMGRVM
jgi:glycerol transport system permease protein